MLFVVVYKLVISISVQVHLCHHVCVVGRPLLLTPSGGRIPSAVLMIGFRHLKEQQIWIGWMEGDLLIQLAGHLKGRALQEWNSLLTTKRGPTRKLQELHCALHCALLELPRTGCVATDCKAPKRGGSDQPTRGEKPPNTRQVQSSQDLTLYHSYATPELPSEN